MFGACQREPVCVHSRYRKHTTCVVRAREALTARSRQGAQKRTVLRNKFLRNFARWFSTPFYLWRARLKTPGFLNDSARISAHFAQQFLRNFVCLAPAPEPYDHPKGTQRLRKGSAEKVGKCRSQNRPLDLVAHRSRSSMPAREGQRLRTVLAPCLHRARGEVGPTSTRR